MNREQAERLVRAMELMIERHERISTSRPPAGNTRDLRGEASRREREAIVDSLVDDNVLRERLKNEGLR